MARSDGERGERRVLRGALRLLGRWAMPVTGCSVFAGLALPDLATALRPALEPAVVILMTIAIARLDWSSLRGYARRPGLTAVIILWTLAISPVLVWTTGSSIGLAPPLLAAVVLNAASAPLMSSVPYCQLLRLDAELAMMAMLVATLLLPVALPIAILWLLHLEVAIAPGDFLVRSGIFIALPLVLVGMLRRFVPLHWFDRHGVELSGSMVIALVVIAIGIMDGVTARVIANPVQALETLTASFAVSVALHLSSGMAFWKLGQRVGLSMAITCGSRNLILPLVIIGDVMGPEFALYVALGQLPIYLMPVAIQPIARRLMARTAI